jgi:hypothetical protein
MATQWWNDLRNARTIINSQYRTEEEEPITRGGARGDIQAGIEAYFDWLVEVYPEEWKTYLPTDLPKSIIPWYERRKTQHLATFGKGYWPFHRDMLPRLVKLNNLNALKAFLVYRNRANNGNTVNKLGLEPGETCVGNKTVAKEAGINEVYLRRANKILAEAGLVIFVRRLWFNGPYVRRVAMVPEEVLRGFLGNQNDVELIRIPFKV